MERRAEPHRLELMHDVRVPLVVARHARRAANEERSQIFPLDEPVGGESSAAAARSSGDGVGLGERLLEISLRRLRLGLPQLHAVVGGGEGALEGVGLARHGVDFEFGVGGDGLGAHFRRRRHRLFVHVGDARAVAILEHAKALVRRHLHSRRRLFRDARALVHEFFRRFRPRLPHRRRLGRQPRV